MVFLKFVNIVFWLRFSLRCIQHDRFKKYPGGRKIIIGCYWHVRFHIKPIKLMLPTNCRNPDLFNKHNKQS